MNMADLMPQGRPRPRPRGPKPLRGQFPPASIQQKKIEPRSAFGGLLSLFLFAITAIVIGGYPNNDLDMPDCTVNGNKLWRWVHWMVTWLLIQGIVLLAFSGIFARCLRFGGCKSESYLCEDAAQTTLCTSVLVAISVSVVIIFNFYGHIVLIEAGLVGVQSDNVKHKQSFCKNGLWSYAIFLNVALALSSLIIILYLIRTLRKSFKKKKVITDEEETERILQIKDLLAIDVDV